MLCVEYCNFQRLMGTHLDYEQSFSYFKQVPLDIADIDPEIRREILRLNNLPFACTDYNYGSCYGFHGDKKNFSHVAVWYKEDSPDAWHLISRLFSNLKSLSDVVLTSEFSSSPLDVDGYYERRVELSELFSIQHFQTDVEDFYFDLSNSGKKNFCEKFWRGAFAKALDDF